MQATHRYCSIIILINVLTVHMIHYIIPHLKSPFCWSISYVVVLGQSIMSSLEIILPLSMSHGKLPAWGVYADKNMVYFMEASHRVKTAIPPPPPPHPSIHPMCASVHKGGRLHSVWPGSGAS